MNSFNGGSFANDQGTPAANSVMEYSSDYVGSTPNGVVSHGKSDHHSKHKKEHSSSKDKHREHKHKDHKHNKEHKSKENHVSSSEHSSSKHHHKDDKPKDKTKEKSKESSSKDKHHDPSKSKHSSDKEKHKSKDDKHKSEKHKSSHESSGDKPKDPLKLVIKPKDGSVHTSNEKHSSSSKHPQKHSSDKHSSSDKHRPKPSSSEKPSSEKHSPVKHTSLSSKHSTEKHSLEKSEKYKSEKVRNESGHKEKHKEKKHYIKEEKEETKVKLKAETLPSPVKIKTETAEIMNNSDSSPPRQMVGMKSPSKMERPVKREVEENDDEEEDGEEESDDEPLAVRMEKVKKKKADTSMSRKRKTEDEDFKPVKKVKKEKTKTIVNAKGKRAVQTEASPSPTKRGKKQEEELEVWKWWEEEKKEGGVKWKTLQHEGPVFAPNYEPLPKKIKFYYDGVQMDLKPETEEVGGFYARMLSHDYVTKDVFNKNFMKDWKKVMTDKERSIITDLSKCNFKEIDAYYKLKAEERKAFTKEQKQEIKKENEALMAKYGFCVIDGHKQKIGNFKIEPPGLFRGRGEHPKMGMLKKRVLAKNVIINIGKEAAPPVPPPGQKWKEVRHDNSVTWLACWTENILGSNKYIMLNPSSKLKGEKDWQKYELARELKKKASSIQKQYQDDWKSKEMRIRQRSVALYFIDKLALRAGNEKEEGETADTVGCCSLRVEHITLDNEKNGKECVVTFDFLGKDSIRYVNSVPVEKRVFRNLKLFMENKKNEDDLFDRLNTSILNKYLNDLMEGLTAKVFRTYNASKTLQEQLDLLTKEDMSVPEKMLAYNRANRAVAILCNHQRSVPKTFDKQMETLQTKIQEKEEQIREVKKEMKSTKDSRDKNLYEKKKRRLRQLEEQLQKLEVQATDKEENKQIALGTSKLNYLDPRISVAWCKKWNVPIEKIYNKTQRDKFRWAIEMATPDYKF